MEPPELAPELDIDRLRRAVRKYIQWYRRHSDPLRGSDLEQAVWLRALETHALAGKSDDEAEKNLVRIARTQLSRERKQRKRQKSDVSREQPLVGQVIADSADGPVEVAAKRDGLAIFVERLRELDKEQREAAEMYILEGKTVTEISEKRGTSKAAASRLIERMKEKARKWFGVEE